MGLNYEPSSEPLHIFVKYRASEIVDPDDQDPPSPVEPLRAVGRGLLSA